MEPMHGNVVGSDGSTYELGVLSPDDTILVVKRKLSEQSEIDMHSMSIFLTGDARATEESLELKNRERIHEIKSYLEPGTSKLEFSVLVSHTPLWGSSSDITERPINKDIEGVTSMAVDANEEFLYFAQCGVHQLSRINIKAAGPVEPEAVLTAGKTYNLAIAGDSLFYGVSPEDSTFRQQQDDKGEWQAVPWEAEECDEDAEWRWAHTPTAAIMRKHLGEGGLDQEPEVFASNCFPIKFISASPAEAHMLYIGFEGPTYGDEGSKVVAYNLATSEEEIVLQDVGFECLVVMPDVTTGQDFVFYATMGDTSPGNTGRLFCKPLGSDEEGTCVADGLASPHTMCRLSSHEFAIGGLGEDAGDRHTSCSHRLRAEETATGPGLQKAVACFSTAALLEARASILAGVATEKVQPTVLKSDVQGNAVAYAQSGAIYYSHYRSSAGIYELTQCDPPGDAKEWRP
jgi:hypothetical protein